MRLSLLVSPLLLLLVFSSLCVAAEDKISDPRLEKKITLEVGLVTLDKLTQEISKQTGVNITAGRNKSDWQVRERRTVLFAKDVPAVEILNRLASLHHYHITRYGETDKWSYSIWQDKNERDEEQALLNSGRIGSDPVKAAQYYTDVAMSPNLSVDELAELQESDPFRYYLLTDPHGKALTMLITLLPQQLWSNKTGWDVSLKTSDPNLQRAAEGMIVEQNKVELMEHPGDELLQTSPASGIRFDPEDSSKMRNLGQLGILWVRVAGSETECPVFLNVPGSKCGVAYSQYIGGLRRGGNREKLWKEMNNAVEKPASEDSSLSVDDPLMREVIKLKQGDDYDYILKAIYKKTGLYILSDQYRESYTGLFSGETPLPSVFKRMGPAGSGKSIKKDSQWLVIRDRRWYEKRAADIPEEYMTELKTKLAKTGFDVHDMAKVAVDLTDDQIEGNGDFHLDLLNVYWQLKSRKDREALRFFGKLTSGQISAMSNGTGVPAQSLPSEVLDHALAAVATAEETPDITEGSFANYKVTKNEVKQDWQLSVILKVPQSDGSVSESEIEVSAANPKEEPRKPLYEKSEE